MLEVKHLKWDSDFFNLKIGSAVVNSFDDLIKIKSLAQNEYYQLIYVYSGNPIYEIDNFYIERKITYYQENLKEINFNIPENIIIESLNETKHWNERLKKLAILCGRYSRFNKDVILQSKFEELYMMWIDKSIKRILADEVIGVFLKKELVGFVTLQKFDRIGKIGLFAIDENHQGKSIGGLLMRMSQKWFLEKNIKAAEVVTQKSNIGACKLYENYGYLISKEDYVYHLWL